MKMLSDVLVVGAGPVGLAMACELARNGVSCRILDKAPAPSTTSKALAIFPRTIEVFQVMGIAEAVLEAGLKIDGVAFYDRSGQIGHIGFSCLPSRYRFAISLPQSETEQILLQQLQKRGISVEWEKELIGISQSERRVRAVIRNADGIEETLESDWLIGCDGAHSSVRHALGVPFEGEAYPETFLLADTKVDSPPDRIHIHMFLGNDGVVGIFPFRSDRCRVIASLGEETNFNEGDEPQLAELQAIVDRRTSQVIQLRDPIWISRFHISRRKIREFRLGRVFLAGDAAHIHSPAGGQGMNTGIQDAFNLAWKIGLVIRGNSPVSLLDTYNEEREPVAKMVLNLTDRMTRMATMQNAFGQQLRNALLPLLTGIHLVEDRVAETMAEIGIHYRRSSVVVGKTARGLHAGDRAPDCDLVDGMRNETIRLLDLLGTPVHQLLFFAGTTIEKANDLRSISHSLASEYDEEINVFVVIHGTRPAIAGVLFDPDGAAHALYEVEPAGIVLIRPDGYIGFRGGDNHVDALREYLAKLFLPRRPFER
jgi:2-polyprenyl-6-methoxyphenol hydroxylase-like FAD-dependent oxidoreductase